MSAEILELQNRFDEIEKTISDLSANVITKGHGQIIGHGKRLEVDKSMRLTDIDKRLIALEEETVSIVQNEEIVGGYWDRHTSSGYIFPRTISDDVIIGYNREPYSMLELLKSDEHPILTITGMHETDYDPQIHFRTGAPPISRFDTSPTVKFSLGVDTADSKFKIYPGEGVGDTSDFVIDTVGSIGFGIDSPTVPFEMYQAATTPIFRITAAHDTLYDPQIQFRTDVTPTVKFSLGVDSETDAFKIFSGQGIGDTTEFVIDTNGNIGIGKVPVDALLDVHGTGYFENYVSFENNLLSKQSDGNYLGRIHITENQLSLSSIASTWTKIVSEADLTSIAMSSDGKYIAYCSDVVPGDEIIISNDYGATWTRKNLVYRVYDICMSSDGKHIYAGCHSGVYVSNDYGENFTQYLGGLGSTGDAVATSSDGRIVLACISGDSVNVSTDYGATWVTVLEGYVLWKGCKVSSDGKYMVAAARARNKLSISSDYGTTWEEYGPEEAFRRVGMSSDGKYVLATTYNSGNVQKSSNYGVTWSSTGVGTTSGDCIISSDGRIQIITDNSNIHLSTDWGENWSIVSTDNINMLAMSSDGKTICGIYDNTIGGGGGVYISYSDSIIRGNLEVFVASTQLKLSYDGSNNCTLGLGSSGDLTITPSGTETILSSALGIKTNINSGWDTDIVDSLIEFKDQTSNNPSIFVDSGGLNLNVNRYRATSTFNRMTSGYASYLLQNSTAFNFYLSPTSDAADSAITDFQQRFSIGNTNIRVNPSGDDIDFYVYSNDTTPILWTIADSNSNAGAVHCDLPIKTTHPTNYSPVYIDDDTDELYRYQGT